VEREYELMYIVRPDLDEDQVRTTMDEVTAMVAGRGGEILKSSLWGRRRLAYLVGGFHDGYYVVADTRLPGDQLGEVERQLRLSENVIRHMLTIARPVRQEGERPARGRERWRDRERGRGRGRGAAAEPGEAESAEVAVAADVPAADDPTAPEAAERPAVPADQPEGVDGPQEMEGSAAPAAGREETDVPQAGSGGVDPDDEEPQEADDDEVEGDDLDDDDDAEDA